MKIRKEDVLNTPFIIGNLEVKNRFVMCAMGGIYLYHLDGSPAQNVIDYYVERARGGCGLIITRAIIVRPIGLDFNLYDKKEIFSPLKKMTREIHKYGCKVFMQLSGGGGRTLHSSVEQMNKRGISKDEAFFAPSDNIPNKWDPTIKHRALSTNEVYEYIESFGKMAELAKELGFDGVEVHALHEGYLLDQFAMKCTNQRNDEFGGGLEGRFRFPCEIIRQIKQTCGNEYPVSIRYSVASKMKNFNEGALPDEDYIEFGRSVDESIKGAFLLEQAGCDMFDMDNGSYDAWYWAHPPIYMPERCNLEESSILKRYVTKPVVCAGKMDTIECTEYIRNNLCDGIGIARALLVDPYYVEKMLSGNREDIKPCIGCHSGCLGAVERNQILGCALNPEVLRKKEKNEQQIKPITDKKNIAVIGAGISGMEAAIRLKKSGHNVSIYEGTSHLGGVFRYASAFDFKERDRRLLQWYERELKLLKIPIYYNYHVDMENVHDLKEDIIISATGAIERKDNSVREYGISALDYIKEIDAWWKDTNVVIIGGGVTGCEIAYALAQKNKKVTIVELESEILGKNLCEANRQFLVYSLKRYQVDIFTKAQFDSYKSGILDIQMENERKSILCDKLIWATGYQPNPLCPNYTDDIEGKRVMYIGDAVHVGNVMDAVNDAYEIVKKINQEK